MFNNYCEQIRMLTKFTKEDILNEKFMLESKNNIKIYYAPHNEIINEKAKILVVGITPGWTQTCIAYKTAQNGLIQNLSLEAIKTECKRKARFAGSMRSNLVNMLDELSLNEKLNIETCSSLFEKDDEMLHTTSMIPYPVFVNNRNYTGSNPKIIEEEILYHYVKKYFYKEVKILSNALIIPLGKSVEEVLFQMIEEKMVRKEQCLLGFPHPSGANGHRKNQFLRNQYEMKKIIEIHFKSSLIC